MIKGFGDLAVWDGNCYVADYTHETPDARGVVISPEPFDDIAYFSLIKVGRGNIPYHAVNLECYPPFIKGINNCECIFDCISDSKRPWLLFLETKYVETAENIDNHPEKACQQMLAVLNKLSDTGMVDPAERRVYFVYSCPPFPDKAPFSSFMETQDLILKSQEERGEGFKINLMAHNELEILTTQYLREPQSRI